MSEPTLQQISEAQLQLIALARNVSDDGINHASASVILDGMDTRLVCIVAARLVNALCRDLARHEDCTPDALLDAIMRVAVEAGAATNDAE